VSGKRGQGEPSISLFGRPDIVLFFQSKVDFKLTVPEESKNAYKHVLMGEKYGKITIK